MFLSWFFFILFFVNLYNEVNFHWHFSYQIKNLKKINGKKWHIVKFIKFYLLEIKIDYKTLYVHKKNKIIVISRAYSQLGYHFFATRLKDFGFAIFQIKNLNGIFWSERYWMIQIMIIFTVVVIFHIHM